MFKVIALVAVVGIFAIGIGIGRGAHSLHLIMIGSSPSAASRSGASLVTTPTALPTVVDKVCVDPTISSNPGFAEGVRREVVSALEAWVPPISSSSPTAAVAATPALTMWVREVTSDSFDTTQPALDLTVPGTPRLPAPPAINDPNLATDQLTWTGREQRWASAVQAARVAVALAVAQLRSYHLEDVAGNYSAISACVAALSQEGVENSSVRFLLASDLEENRRAVVGTYRGAPFLIDQSCPDSAIACVARAARWKARLQRQGAGDVSIVRADAATAVIRSWLLGGRS